MTKDSFELKMDYIASRSKSLTQLEKSYMILLHQRLKTSELMQGDNHEALFESLYSKNELQQTHMELFLLKRLLEEFLGKKSLKDSLLKASELLNMIHYEKNKIKEDTYNADAIVLGIKELLEGKNEK